jgi:sensor histidine kinase YesM
MKKSRELTYNIIVIASLILIDFGWGLFTSNNKTFFLFYTLLLAITFSISFFSVYIINYYYFLPKLLGTKKYPSFILSIILMIFTFAGIRFLLEEVVLLSFFNIHNYNSQQENIVFQYLLDSLIYAFKACLYSSIVYLLFRHNESKDNLYQLNLEHQKAQLTNLKAQISPHFLFNTLNNFYAELYDDKPETANDILKFSQLLRYETSEDFVLLEKEIQFIQDYLYFFKRRYEDDFHVSLSINGVIKNHKIPSLILIHFIENVSKHGIINNEKYPAKIEVIIKDETLEIVTENNISTSEKHMESGIGTANIQKRLEVIFKDNFTLEYKKINTIFKAYLKLPL